MSKLKKYQIDAVVNQIVEDVNSKMHPLRNTKAYKQKAEKLAQKALSISKAIVDMKAQITGIKREMDAHVDKYRELVGGNIVPYNENRVMEQVERKVDQEFEIEPISVARVERLVILSDMEGSSDIIKEVLDKLGYKE